MNRSKIAAALLAAEGYVVDTSPPAYMKELIRMYRDGASASAIARALDISPAQVYRAAKVNGLPGRRPRRR